MLYNCTVPAEMKILRQFFIADLHFLIHGFVNVLLFYYCEGLIDTQSLFHHRFDLFSSQLWMRLELIVTFRFEVAAFVSVLLVFCYVVGFHGLKARDSLIQVKLKHFSE